jgi:hypothetical protein
MINIDVIEKVYTQYGIPLSFVSYNLHTKQVRIDSNLIPEHQIPLVKNALIERTTGLVFDDDSANSPVYRGGSSIVIDWSGKTK